MKMENIPLEIIDLSEEKQNHGSIINIFTELRYPDSIAWKKFTVEISKVRP